MAWTFGLNAPGGAPRVTARSKRIVGVAVGSAVVAVLVALFVFYFTIQPPTVQSVDGSGGTAEITLQTVGALGPRYEHPDWVSYLVRDASGEWVHSTEIEVPANTLVRVTVLQYDSETGGSGTPSSRARRGRPAA